jgi:glycosyltransferase involved in cell wall biosynthesis
MRRKLLFVVTEDYYFWSHRLPLARAALRHGYEVVVATRVSNYAEKIRNEGFRLIPLQLNRESYSPWTEFRAIRQLRQIYRTERPDLAHHVALKPILYGSIAALGSKDTKVINAWAGLGYLIASSSLKARILRMFILNVFGLLMRRSNYHVLLQNSDDRELLIKMLKLPREKTTLIRSSGVDVNCFVPVPEPSGPPVVLLASRMLWNKGVKDFVEAARLLQAHGLPVRFVLVGDKDPRSPSGIPREQLLEWQSSGAVEWWGHQSNMAEAFHQATLVCLPSHGGEGVPKTLLEAAASARAIVTTDVPGCRDIVRHGINGLLVPPHSPEALAASIEKLLRDSALRQQMAIQGREVVVKEFSQESVVEKTLALYEHLLESAV